MNKSKMIMNVILMTSSLIGQSAFADFDCKGDEGLSVLVEHTEPVGNGLPFLKDEGGKKGKNVKVKILKEDDLILDTDAMAKYSTLRGSNKYSYKFNEDTEVKLTIHEFSHLETFPPNCSKYSRIPCDYNFVITYSGSLHTNGESHDLDCQAE